MFSDYVRPVAMTDFGAKNIIYGWNYSGKTTISRLFGFLENKKPLNSAHIKFSLLDDAGQINEQNYQSNTSIVRVFNSDFIENNLNFAGTAFNPILLLGSESNDAVLNIAKLEALLARTIACDTKCLREMVSVTTALMSAKTQESAAIKRKLGLIPAFGATQLTNCITEASLGFDNTLSNEELANNLAIAQSSDADKLRVINKLELNLQLVIQYRDATILLNNKPEFTNTISYLAENADVTEWVEAGLPLHDHQENCEFCGSPLRQERLNELRAHFSQDLINHKADLNALIAQIEASMLPNVYMQESQFNLQFRKRMKLINDNLLPAIDGYNADLNVLLIALRKKLKTPFTTQQLALLDEIHVNNLIEQINLLNTLIDENNAMCDNFPSEKNNAIERLKLHYTQEFITRERLTARDVRLKTLQVRQKKLGLIKPKIEKSMKEQKAIINLAQKGSEEINKRIQNLLGSDSIQIKVLFEGGLDRFQLVRGSEVALHLSEGEKTAVAFAFFLTKLQELTDISKAIIYIDDPISSLDSNHIFQIAAIIKNTFFYQSTPEKSPWQLKCKQIFLSTHNFEFFSLLRELPLSVKESRYFMVKRTSPTTSTLIDLPQSILRYSSEYHYLFNVLHEFNNAPDKTEIEVLLLLPNAIRRFVELYTYARCPDYATVGVDTRASRIFGEVASKRILKVLHTFSHSNNIERIATNNDLICDIENVVRELMDVLKKDEMHYGALLASVVSMPPPAALAAA